MKKPKEVRQPLRRALVDILNQEITWHRNNRGGSGCSPAFEGGFITGLVQARRLLRKALKELV